METKEIGRMMYTLRLKKGISQEDLCRGLCSVATLCRMEVGERRPDILVFNALMQRLGKNPYMIDTVLTLEEFSYFVKRRNIEISLEMKEYERAEKELLELEAEEIQEPLRRQDIYRMYGLLYLSWEKKEKAVEYLQKAISETLPEFAAADIRELWLSETETVLLLLYAYALEPEAKNVEKLLLAIIQYIQRKVTDEEAADKRMAQTMYLLARIKRNQKQWKECYRCCEAAIEAEVKNGVLLLLPQALQMELLCLEQGLSIENGELRKKEYQALSELMLEYGRGIVEENENLVSFTKEASQEKQVIDELISRARERKEMTQEELSEQICAPETLSRIERGKRNPTIKNFHAFMEKMELGMGYYNTDLKVEQFETLEKGQQLRKAVILQRYEEAEELLKEIEFEIDATVVENKQYLEFYHIAIDESLERISASEALQRLESALELKLKKQEDGFQLPKQLTSVEISLFNSMAIRWKKQGKQKKSVEILKALYDYFKESKVEKELGVSEHGRDFLMVLSNLASHTEETDDLVQAMEYVEEVIEEGIRIGIGIRIGKNLILKGYIQEREGKEICLQTYRQAYYLCELYKDFKNKHKVKEHVEDVFKCRLE